MPTSRPSPRPAKPARTAPPPVQWSWAVTPSKSRLPRPRRHPALWLTPASALASSIPADSHVRAGLQNSDGLIYDHGFMVVSISESNAHGAAAARSDLPQQRAPLEWCPCHVLLPPTESSANTCWRAGQALASQRVQEKKGYVQARRSSQITPRKITTPGATSIKKT